MKVKFNINNIAKMIGTTAVAGILVKSGLNQPDNGEFVEMPNNISVNLGNQTGISYNPNHRLLGQVQKL